MSTQNNNTLAWILLIVLALCFGASFVFIKLALEGFDVYTVAFGRVFIAAILLVAALYASGRSLPLTFAMWRRFFFLSLFNNIIPHVLIVFAQTRIEAGLAAILNSTVPLVTVLLLPMMARDERTTANKVVGMAVGFFGVILLMGPDLLLGLGNRLTGQLAMLGAVISFSVGALYAKKMHDIHPQVSATGMIVTASIVLGIVAFTLGDPLPLPPLSRAWLGMFGVAIFSTVVAYLIFFPLVKMAGASFMVLNTYLIPIVGLTLSAIILNEPLTFGNLGGMAIIFAGLALTDNRVVRRLKRTVGWKA